MNLDVSAHTDIGETELLNDDHDGSQSLHYDAPGSDATLVIDADVGVGKIEVSHA